MAACARSFGRRTTVGADFAPGQSAPSPLRPWPLSQSSTSCRRMRSSGPRLFAPLIFRSASSGRAAPDGGSEEEQASGADDLAHSEVPGSLAPGGIRSGRHPTHSVAGADAPPDAAPPAPPAEASTSSPPLTLGSEVLERMARLRALDQYRELMDEEGAAATAAAAAAARPSVRQGGRAATAGTGTGTPRGLRGGSFDAAAAAGDDSALLLRGALLIARHRYPSLDEQKVYDTLDDMARRVAALLPADAEERYPLRVVAAVNRVMYHDFGFRGNEEDYYNADNSCINRVMERRVGIPITLSLVYSEVARRVGLPMRGVNLPGHFMLQPVRPSSRQRQHQSQQQQQQRRPDTGEEAPPVGPSAAAWGPGGAGADGLGRGAQAGGEGGSATGGEASVSASSAGGGGGGVAGEPMAGGQAAASGRETGGYSGGEAARGAEAAAAAASGDEEEEEEEAGPLEVLIDAFKSGEVCYPAEAEERISQLLGQPVRIDPRALQESRPLPPRLFLMRMLGNLRSIYLTTQQVDSLLMVLKFMRATLGEGPAPSRASVSSAGAAAAAGQAATTAEGLWSDPVAFASAAASLARDEGLCYFALRRYPECLEALREYLRLVESVAPALPLSSEEKQTVSALMEQARLRMTQQAQ